ncbi:UDP-glucose 4-epimerase-like isoform X2 [Tachypleus tridentatus]
MTSNTITVLVTGAAGYIGCHVVLELLQSEYDIVAIDSFITSQKTERKGSLPPSLERVHKLTNRPISFHMVDLLDSGTLTSVFKQHKIDCVIHCAGVKGVRESYESPLKFYQNNLEGTINLLNVMEEARVRKILFASTCTMYGNPEYLPMDERHPVMISRISPYSRTKVFCEEILKDICSSNKEWKVLSLRYFNPVGSHESGMIGEYPNGVPSILIPLACFVALGLQPEVQIFGNDFETRDGTAMRDYVHISDLASCHLNALNKLFYSNFSGWKAYNLGSGKGYTVTEVIETLEKTSGKIISKRIVPRRSGDAVASYADITLAEKELGWKAERGLEKMCQDAWRWHSQNPNGYDLKGKQRYISG